ncbi:tRNA lysidine(34) synthetase TilS [Alkalicella caledoniensis]|uniref:tRNA(Ile)-lysidine synthase n=1 Tax=Alkalicella caledoniensis TaxID=2731377 RepID=A0A7G9W847_ALKCA|nr:tRNA lysidine(34) synthetase TilS [Alkalicella caledoniensis]QNO14859.1 tRNA lysidine(34) synthetase TilS [Alkalicella caledoniensis]
MLHLENHIKGFIIKYNLKGKKVVVAVSGGPDSIALLYILKNMGLCIHVAHLNHDLRGEESEKDAQFVKYIAKSLGLPYTIEKRQVLQGGSLQNQARKTRYNFLRDVCDKESTNIVALAQHKDDQLETILMNFFRGAGLTGLSGIKEMVNQKGLILLRPLLDFTKKDIMQFLDENSIKYRVDSSNKKDKYSRNKFRLNIIPFLEKELGDGFKSAVINNSKIHKLEEEYFTQEATRVLSLVDKTKEHQGYKLVLDTSLSEYHPALIGWVLRIAFVKNDLYDLRELSSSHYQVLIDSIVTNKATTLQLPNGIKFARWGSNLGFFIKVQEGNKTLENNKNIGVEINKITVHGDEKILITKDLVGNPNHVVDLSNAHMPLTIRKREDGDIIKLSPNGGTKKVKDIFIDKKIAKHNRDEIPLLVDAKNNIIAILGHRVSGPYYIKEGKGHKYYIYINRNGGN